MEESTVASMVLPVHRLTPYLRVRIFTGDRSTTIEERPALFGCIPLRRRRIELTPRSLSSFHFRTLVRYDALAAAAVAVASIFLLHPGVVGVVGLAVAGVLLVLLGMPNRAVVIARTDGRTFTVRFCRDYEFDVGLALTDLEERRFAPPSEGPGAIAA